MIDVTDHGLTVTVLAALIGTVAVARATRLATSDAYPPAVWVRRWWFNQTAGKGGWREGWAMLISGDDGKGGCPFCFAPYAAAVNLGWAWWSDLGMWWWLVNVWAAVSYVAAMIVVRDEPPPVD